MKRSLQDFTDFRDFGYSSIPLACLVSWDPPGIRKVQFTINYYRLGILLPNTRLPGNDPTDLYTFSIYRCQDAPLVIEVKL